MPMAVERRTKAPLRMPQADARTRCIATFFCQRTRDSSCPAGKLECQRLPFATSEDETSRRRANQHERKPEGERTALSSAEGHPLPLTLGSPRRPSSCRAAADDDGAGKVHGQTVRAVGQGSGSDEWSATVARATAGHERWDRDSGSGSTNPSGVRRPPSLLRTSTKTTTSLSDGDGCAADKLQYYVVRRRHRLRAVEPNAAFNHLPATQPSGRTRRSTSSRAPPRRCPLKIIV